MRGRWAAAFVPLALLLVAAAPRSDGGATDYAATADGRSTPDYPELVTEAQHVTTSAGTQIYVEVTLPDPAEYPQLRVPVIMHVSPYNNFQADRSGTSLVREAVNDIGAQVGMAGWFPPRGYAWVTVDLPGSGHSTGCFDHLGRNDQADLADVVGWAATQPWSTGRVGVIGHSYDGFSAATTAAVGGPAVVTAVISAGGASLYDHQFQHGVQFLAQWAGTSAYPALATTRFLDSDDVARDAPWAACGFLSGSAFDGPGQVTGQYGAWHAERDQRTTLAERDDVDLFVVQGLDDVQIRASALEWFLTDREPRSTDKLWIGPWAHGEDDHLNGRGVQWLHALHAWFDRTLQERDVPTGPAVEAFFDTGEAVAMDQWRPAREFAQFFPDATDLSLRLGSPGEPGTAAFSARGNTEGVDRLTGWDTSGMVGDGGLDFVSDPLPRDLVVVGLPDFELHASVSGEIVHLVTTLYRIDDRGRERLLNTCAIQPQLREGIDTFSPVVPGEVMALPLQCFPTSHRLLAGERLRLHVGTGSLHHVPLFSADARIEVHTGPDTTRYGLPERPDLAVQRAPDPQG